MTHLGQLAYFAGSLAQEYIFKQLLEFAEDDWKDDHSCQYVTLTDSALIQHLTGGLFPEDMDVELVKVTGTLTPHIHEKSDSVVAVRGIFAEEGEGWFDIDRSWHVLYDNQIIVIPKGVPHGFKLDDVSREPFYLIVVSNPPIADDDTTYIE